MIFTEDEKDCLQELMNISFGSATAAISKIIDKFATLGIPQITTISSDDLKEHLSEKIIENDSIFIASQLINGEISGENLFIIDEKSSFNLAKEFDLEDDEINMEEMKDIILEITNIISSTTISKLSDLLGGNIAFSSPRINFIKSINEFNHDFYCDYESIIIISTELKFEDQNIEGELVIMTKKESSLFLKESLNRVIDEL